MKVLSKIDICLDGIVMVMKIKEIVEYVVLGNMELL